MASAVMSGSRLPAALVAPALALVVTVAGCAGTTPPASGSSGSSSAAASSGTANPSGRRIEVQVTGGRVSGDTGRVRVAAGERVTLVVTSDTADGVHVHGYDLAAGLSPGEPAEIAFDATVPGIFEVELHEVGTLLLSLQVG
jgi:hypothetical protein